MKKLFLFVIPIFIAVIAFGIFFLLSKKNTGKGALQVTSVPKSQVILDGKPIGQTPLCKCDPADMIPIGEYTLRLVPLTPGFDTFEQKIIVNKSVLTVVDRTFGKGAESTGSILTLSKLDEQKALELLIVSFPDKATITLDNAPVGQTPFVLKNITESDHEMTLSKEGYIDTAIRIRTVAGYKLAATVFLGVNPNLASVSANLSQNQEASSSAQENAVASSSATPASAKVVILETPTGFLRVRDAASLNAAEIARVSPNETFSFISEENGWYAIKLKDGKLGWVNAQYAKKE